MAASKFEICADEAWTHSSVPPNRYWCFLGGLFGTESETDAFEARIRMALKQAGYNAEVKWSATTQVTLLLFQSLVDLFFDELRTTGLRYRQIFLDRSYVHVPAPAAPSRSALDAQYLVYYQFIKHHFDLAHLPAVPPGDKNQVLLRLDDHSSQKHKANLTKFAEALPGILARPDIEVAVTYVNSKKFRRLQVCDLLMGAAGWYGNKWHLRREPGQRGMKPRQKARLALAQHVYNHLRGLDRDERGSKAFNWFESTSDRGDPKTRISQSVRIWKFIPANHKIDFGFKNKNLDRQGRYQGPRW